MQNGKPHSDIRLRLIDPLVPLCRFCEGWILVVSLQKKERKVVIGFNLNQRRYGQLRPIRTPANPNFCSIRTNIPVSSVTTPT